MCSLVMATGAILLFILVDGYRHVVRTFMAQNTHHR